MTSTGAILDTIPAPLGEADRVFPSVRTQAAISPLGYRVHARNDEYAFYRTLRDGRAVRIERSWTPVPIGREEREDREAYNKGRERVNGLEGAPVSATKPPFSSFSVDAEGRIWVEVYAPASPTLDVEREMARRRAFATQYPGFPQVTWAPFLWRQPAVYEVIEPSGRFFGRVTLPNAWREDSGNGRSDGEIMLARGMTVWAVEYGEFDEPYVVKYRIVPGN
jgi:hypothetical protein